MMTTDKAAFMAAMQSVGCDVRVIKDKTPRFTRWYILNEKTGSILFHYYKWRHGGDKQE